MYMMFPQRVLRVLYTNNPFYVLSAACLMFSAVDLVCPGSDVALVSGLLVAAIVLFSTTAVAIVRWGGVWEDARSLLLIVVLLMVALSCSIDLLLMQNASLGRAAAVAGFGFCVAISQVLLRLLAMRIAWRMQLPMYAVLALMFFFPGVLSRLSASGDDPWLTWATFLFPSVASAPFLALLPVANSRNVNRVATGTPWSWPWYPWSAVAILWAGAVLRSVGLAIAFHPQLGLDMPFGGYFLAPLVLGGCLLVFELCDGANRKWRMFVEIAPVGLLAALLGPRLAGGELSGFEHASLVSYWGTPVFVVLVLLSLYYAYLYLRGSRLAYFALVGGMIALTLCGRQAPQPMPWLQWWPLPLTALAGLQWLLLFNRRTSLKLFAALSTSGLALTLYGPTSWVLSYGGLLPLTALSMASLACGYLFCDGAARTLRLAGAVGLAALAVGGAIATGMQFDSAPELLIGLQAATALALLALVSWTSRNIEPMISGFAVVVAWLLSLATRGYRMLEESTLGAVAAPLVAAMLFFAAGLVISILKSGRVRRFWHREPFP